ncbi:chemotaxis protein CheW [Paenibacillus sp. OK003]|uniref:chemotaxis protein CheW n=1 Tax=Paenibacillus sp. OK003 TaxID=1884380 RepID=UPI000B86E41A|nr:chemotaxis protein CheW [Paenibacillus sp. OK003]
MKTFMDEEVQVQYINFSVGNQICALRIDEVHEIIKMLPVTTVPFGSPEIKGFTPLYGKVVSVVSVRVLLGMPDEEPTPSTRIIVVPYHDAYVPLVVDSVDSVVMYDRFEEPTEEYRRYTAGIFKEIAHNADHEAGILNLDVLLGNLTKSQ